MSKRRDDATASTVPVNAHCGHSSSNMMAARVMEASGDELWKLLRPRVKATGPLKVVRRIGWDGYLHDRIGDVVEQWGAARVLTQLGLDAHPIDVHNAAWKGLADLATRGKPLSVSTKVANRVALAMLDACAELGDNPGAAVAASVIEVIGIKVASLEVDSGLPGSGQPMLAWRVGNRIFVTGDDGDSSRRSAYAVSDSLRDVLAWWIRDWVYPDITGAHLHASVIRALGLVRGDDDDWEEGSVRINGRMWRRPAAGSAES